MGAFSNSADDPARLEAVRRYELACATSDAALDELTALASMLCDAPISLITLVGEDRQWLKSATGLAAGETPRSVSFCDHAIATDGIFVVPDAAADPRFFDNPLVTGEPGIRFYAGATLVAMDGHRLGALCVIDRVPRELTPVQLEALRVLGRQAMAQLELRREWRERAARESALSQSEALTSAVMHSALDGIIVMDHDGRIVEFNPAAARLFGVPRDAAIGRDVAGLMPPALRERHRLGLQRYLRTGEGVVVRTRLETTAMRDDGTEFPIELAIIPIEGDGPPRFTGFVRDLSFRQEAEAALRLSDERFQLVTRATNDATWDWDLEAGTLWWNKGFQTLYGYAPEDIEPGVDSWTSRIHRDDLARVKQSIGAVLKGDDTAWADEYRFVRKDGTFADILDRGYVIRDETGKAVRMVGVMIDLTERKRAEEQLRAAEERFRQIAEYIQQVFWITDTASGALIYVSPAYESVWGRSRASLYAAPHTWIDSVHPDDRGRMSLAAAAQTAGGFDEVYRIVRPDGAIRWVRDRAFPIRDAAGDVYRIVGTATDITEQRQLQEQFLQSQKMESVGRLTGGIAHDFNNLLTVITAAADLALAQSTEAAVREDLEEVRQAAARAALLTGQLLALSRQQILKPEVINLSATLGGMQGMLRRLIGEHIECVFALPPGLRSIQADASQMEQVVLNLAVNARDAMPEGGRLDLVLCDVTLGQAEATAAGDLRPGRYVRLTVRDTGVGMDEATRQKAFEPFFTTKALGKGSGLGLSTVYGIVRQSGGSVAVDSEPGAGATFQIYLPAVDGDPAPAPLDEPIETRATSGQTILLVEDEPRLRKLASRILRADSYTVIEAESGEHALELASRHRGAVHLLLTDVVMPGMNGRELATRLGEARPDTRILFTSGYTDDAILRHGVLEDTRQFLGKPYTPEQLRRRVRDMLDAAD